MPVKLVCFYENSKKKSSNHEPCVTLKPGAEPAGEPLELLLSAAESY